MVLNTTSLISVPAFLSDLQSGTHLEQKSVDACDPCRFGHKYLIGMGLGRAHRLRWDEEALPVRCGGGDAESPGTPSTPETMLLPFGI